MPSLFDAAELMDRVDDDTEFLAETVAALSADARRKMVDLAKAIAAGDASRAAEAAHALKGMIGNFCAPLVQKTAGEIEAMARSGDLTGAPLAMETLRQHLLNLIDELEAFVKARASCAS